MDKQTLGRGAVHIYIQFIVSAISGYIFWLIMTQLTSSAIIGTLSVIISVSEILTSVAILGLPDSIQRFLGRTFYEKREKDSKIYVSASLLLAFVGIIISILLVFIGTYFFEITELDSNLKLIIILVFSSNCIQTLLNSIIISSLKTQSLPLINITCSIVKIILSIILAISGYGVTAIAISYLLVPNMLLAILFGIVSSKLLKSISKKDPGQGISFKHATQQVLIGGVANWVPLLVTTVGYQLGTITVYGFKGSTDTAVYFLTLSIVTAILLGATSLFTIALPALSSMDDARKRLAWQTIRWGSLASIPLSCSLVFYSKDIMKLFGANYIQGELSLQILLLSVLPSIIAGGIGNLAFSYGNYKQSFTIDLVMNIPRTVLYFILVPIFGIAGGAISFSTGSLLAAIVSCIIIAKIKMLIFWKDLALIFVIPLGIGFVMHSLGINFIVGITVSIIATYLLLLKTNSITNSDINDFLSIMPDKISNKIYAILKKIMG
jgi:O-antigen/teichoic acid export membrane protein